MALMDEPIILPPDAGERAALLGLNQPPINDPLDPDYNGQIDPPEDSWEPINLAELGDKPPVKPTLGAVGLVYPGKRHVFSGPQESAKTLAAYAIALQVVRKGDIVAVIDFEMGRWDARDRLQDLGATPDDLNRIHYIDPSEPATTERITRLVNLQPELVIIDAAAGAYDIQGLDDNKRADVERFTRIYVRDFWRNGIATIVLDHVVKNTENRGKYAIGSERKVGGADVHLGFEVVTPINRGSVGLYKILTHKDRGGYLQRGRLADLHLTSDPVTHRITWRFEPAEHGPNDEPWRPTVLMQRVSEYLATHPLPQSFNQVITNVKGRDAKVKEAIEHLVALGHAAEEEGERGARNVRLITPYTAPLPTSAAPLPEEVTSTSATSAPSFGGQSVADTAADDVTSARPIDVNDPAVQALLDDDIPW